MTPANMHFSQCLGVADAANADADAAGRKTTVPEIRI